MDNQRLHRSYGTGVIPNDTLDISDNDERNNHKQDHEHKRVVSEPITPHASVTCGPHPGYLLGNKRLAGNRYGSNLVPPVNMPI